MSSMSDDNMVTRMSDNVAQADDVQLRVRVHILERAVRMHKITLATALWITSWIVPLAREDLDLRQGPVGRNLTQVLEAAWSEKLRWSDPDQTSWSLRIGTGLLLVGLLWLALLYIVRWVSWSDDADWPLWVAFLVVTAGAVLTAVGIATLPDDSWGPTPWVILPVALCILVLNSEKIQADR